MIAVKVNEAELFHERDGLFKTPVSMSTGKGVETKEKHAVWLLLPGYLFPVVDLIHDVDFW